MIKSINDIKKEVTQLREEGVQRGDLTGFKSIDDLYSIKRGTYTIVLGAPTHGKSEIIFEMMMNQAIKYGRKGIILSPETGNSQEVTMELIHKYLGKNPYKSSFGNCTDREFEQAFNWIDFNFAVADDEDKSYSFKELTDEIAKHEKLKNYKFENIMAEPWNELDHKLLLSENSGRQDLAIEDELTQLRRYCKQEQKHTFLSFHPSHQTIVKDAKSNISYYEMPKAREAAGGQATLRKAFSWINIWRPPLGVINSDTGMPFLENEVFFQVEKSKPKGVGKKGMTKLNFDWQKNRYYEEINGVKLYAFEHENTVISHDKVIMQPSKHFSEPTNEEIPF